MVKESYQLKLLSPQGEVEMYQVERWPAENFRGWHVRVTGSTLDKPLEDVIDNQSLVDDYGFQMVNTLTVGDADLWQEVVSDLLHERELGLK